MKSRPKERKKAAKSDPSLKETKCFLLSEQLIIALTATTKAEIESRRSTPTFHEAMTQAKSALLTASIVSGKIATRAKSIIRELTKEEARVAAGRSSTEAGRMRAKDSISDTYHKIRNLMSESEQQCGMGQHRKELNSQGVDLLGKLEKEAEAALPAPPKGVWGWTPGGRPVFSRPKGGKK